MMREISQIGKEMLLFQEELAKKHKYEPVPINLFTGDVRDKYRGNLPDWCKEDGEQDRALFSACGTQICTGYERVVIGDYGAFVEINPKQIMKQFFCCKQGQEYRYNDPRYAEHVKYLWLTTKDKSDCKIYYQKKTVDYADYKIGMYYISPYEVWTTKQDS